MENIISPNKRLTPHLPFLVQAVEEEVSLLIGVVFATLIAVMGGAVNWLRHKHKKDWGTFIAAIVTAAFTGLLSHLITSWLELDVRLQYAISGAAGYSGGLLLDSVAPLLIRLFQEKIESKHNETLH